jgi:hypothetical protein
MLAAASDRLLRRARSWLPPRDWLARTLAGGEPAATTHELLRRWVCALFRS